MAKLDTYLEKRGISGEQMRVARQYTQAVVDAYNLREARKACNMTQVELAHAMGVSQNRVSRIESGDIGAMSLDTVRGYIESVGGSFEVTAELPAGKVQLV